VLFHLFAADSQDMDEDRIVKSATGIRNTVVWKKALQVSSAMAWLAPSTSWIDSAVASSLTASASAKPSRHSPSSSTTSYAMTVFWYFVQRLRDNWTLYKANDQREHVGV